MSNHAPDPRHKRGALRDAVLYGASGVHALAISLLPVHTIYRSWGRTALWFYFAGALLSMIIHFARKAATAQLMPLRSLVCAGVLMGAALLPMAEQIWLRTETGPGRHAQSHTIIVEEAARKTMAGENPYRADYSGGPLGSWNEGVRTHFPYMPLMIAFGLPRALFGDSWMTDARVVFAIAGLALFALAALFWQTSGDRKLLALQVLVALPTGSVFLSGGGHELPVLALMLLGLVLLDGSRFGRAGIALGIAAAIKQTSWLLIPFVAVASFRRGGGRSAIRNLVATVSAAVPIGLAFFAWHPAAFVEDVVRFPLDIGTQKTIARGPTLGGLLLRSFPSSRTWLLFLLLSVAVAIAALFLVRWPPSSARTAALQAGVVFILLLALSPTGRAGYVLYPINLLVWAALMPREAYGSRGVPSLQSKSHRRGTHPDVQRAG